MIELHIPKDFPSDYWKCVLAWLKCDYPRSKVKICIDYTEEERQELADHLMRGCISTEAEK